MSNWTRTILASLIFGATVILVSAADKPKIVVVYP